MNKGFSRVELICGIVFFIAALLCGAWFLLYGYFVAPEIKLNGSEEVILKVNDKYEDAGAIAILDNVDITDKIVTENKVDNTKVGTYEITYSVTNNKGRKKQTVTRIVKVRDDVKPEIKLKGGSPYKVQYGSTFTDPGYTATDNYDGDITKKVKTNGEVNTHQLGSSKIYYSVTDSSENTTTVTREIKVVDTTAPILALNGKERVQIPVGGNYEEPGYSAKDNLDGDVTSKVRSSGSINKNVPGIYKISYSVTDKSGNTAYATRIVQVGTQAEIDNANRIEVSISGQSACLYKNGSVKFCSPIVTGQRGKWDTPRGTFRIRNKGRNTKLKGPDYESFVSFWSGFDYSGAYGFHDASWRGSFGGSIYISNGSHGCINMPYWAAESVYYNAPIGTLVKIY